MFLYVLQEIFLQRECFVMTVDIDAAFDHIVLAEDNLVVTGYKEGYTQVTQYFSFMA